MSCSSTLLILHPSDSPHPFITVLILNSLDPSVGFPDTLSNRLNTVGTFVIAKMLGIWKSTVRSWILGVTLSFYLNLASGIKVDVSPANPKAGDNVILKVTDISGTILFATWYKGQSTDAANQILNFFPPNSQFKGNMYFEEAHGQANGSLAIDNVRTDFNGFYTVQVQTKDSLQQSSVNLNVNGAISIALAPLALLLGMLLFSDVNFL